MQCFVAPARFMFMSTYYTNSKKSLRLSGEARRGKMMEQSPARGFIPSTFERVSEKAA